MGELSSFRPRQCWLLAVVVLAGCGSSKPIESAPKQMVFVDTATMSPLVHDEASSFPAVHPKTGQRTLSLALYCSTCKKWYPVPPLDQINRVPGAGKCPKDKSVLTVDGPWPDGSKPETAK